jgi:hypothetical protein
MMLYIANDMDLAVEKALIHGADPTIHDDQFRNSYMLADLHKSYESLEVLEIFYMDGSPNGSRFKLLNKRLSDEIKDFKDPKITPELLTKESREDGVSNLYQFARYGFLSEIIKKLGKKTSVLTSDNILEFGSHFAGHEDTPLQAHTLFNREYGLLLKADLWKTNPKGFRVFTSCIPLDEYPLYKDTINKVLQELKPPFTARINDKENNGLRLKR